MANAIRIFDPNKFRGALMLGLVGGIAGGLFAGIVGRASMRAVALLAGETPGFTIEGTLFVLLAGIVMGASAGLVFSFALPFLPGPALRKGFSFGGLLAGSIVLIVLLAELEGELDLLSRWALIALFAPIPLLYGSIMGWVTARITPRESNFMGESLDLARSAGLLTIAFALTVTLFELVLAVTHPAVANLGTANTNILRQVAGGATLLMIFTGLSGLLRSGATGKLVWAKVGMGLALLLVAVLGMVALGAGLRSMEVHGLFRLIAGINSSSSLGWLGVAPFALGILGLILAGIAVLRIDRWGGWRAYSPLLVGLSPLITFLLLDPRFFPGLLKLSLRDRAQLGHWVAALYALAWLVLGLALHIESDQHGSKDDPQ